MNKRTWTKHGIVLRPDLLPTGYEKIMVPTPMLRSGSQHTGKLFFTSVDAAGRGSVFFASFDLSSSNLFSSISGPILQPSEGDSFDRDGVMATSVVQVDETTLYMYYTGFRKELDVRYRLATGVAVSRDSGETFSRICNSQILKFNPNERDFRSGSYVDYDGSKFRMWYVAGNSWVKFKERNSPAYDLYYLESNDGIVWPDYGKRVLSAKDIPDAFAIGRPWVRQQSKFSYTLFFSYRNLLVDRYRLAYANSSDGLTWSLDPGHGDFDDTILDFESDSRCYSAVISCNGILNMFYNGNDLGRDGVALATLGIDK